MVDGEEILESQKWRILAKCPWISVNLESITTVDGLYQLPRYYAYATNPENKEYEYTQVEWSTPEFYDICKRIGRGKYSEVFSGVHVDNKGEPVQDIIIKVLKPIKKAKTGDFCFESIEGWSQYSKCHRRGPRPNFK